MAQSKYEARQRRKRSIRKRVKGTPSRPRLTVFRSARHIYAQVVDDEAHRVLAAVSTVGKGLREEVAGKAKTEQAKVIGERIAALCKERGVEAVVFDRNGYRYHGRVRALAAAAREAGLRF